MGIRARHILLTAALLASPAVARAQAPCAEPERVRELKQAGDRAIDAARGAEALTAYKQALDACGDTAGDERAALLYNLGRASLSVGDFAAALTHLEAFDQAASPGLKEKVPALRELIDEQRARVGSLRVASNVAGARVRVRDKVVGQAPLSAPLRLASGRATVEVQADGYQPFTREVEVRAGAVTSVDAVLVAIPKAIAPADTGTVVVRSAVEGTLVYVDGRPFGLAPVEAKVLVGPHRVLVHLDGHRDTDREVHVAKGQRTDLDLSPERVKSIAERWWFWTGVGVVLAAGVTTAVVAATTERAPDKGTLVTDPIPVRLSHGIRF